MAGRVGGILSTTGWLRKSQYSFEVSDSTNDIAMKLASGGCAHGTVVISKNQISGRGRHGRKWHAWPGTLALSIVLRPELHFSQAYRLVLASALGTIDALTRLQIPALLKWPNDIVVSSLDTRRIQKIGPFRKVGGILLELGSTGETIDTAVIGIGLNLNRPQPEDQIELLEQMGFLSDYQAQLSFDALKDILLESLEHRLEHQSLRIPQLTLLESVKAKSMLLGRSVIVTRAGSSIEGMATDLHLDGGLVVKDRANQMHVVHFGDVSLL